MYWFVCLSCVECFKGQKRIEKMKGLRNSMTKPRAKHSAATTQLRNTSRRLERGTLEDLSKRRCGLLLVTHVYTHIHARISSRNRKKERCAEEARRRNVLVCRLRRASHDLAVTRQAPRGVLSSAAYKID